MDQHGSEYLPVDTPSIPGLGSKVKTFYSESSHVAYKIKGNPCTMLVHILSSHARSTIGVGSKRFFLNVVMLYIKLKEKKYRPT